MQAAESGLRPQRPARVGGRGGSRGQQAVRDHRAGSGQPVPADGAGGWRALRLTPQVSDHNCVNKHVNSITKHLGP